MMRTTLASFVSFLLFCLCPVHAGTVYLPVSNDFAGAEGRDTFQLLVTNTDVAVAKPFAALLLPSGTDGTQRDGLSGSQSQVPAGSTVLFDVVPSQVGTGLLEIDAAPELAISARMLVSDFAGGPPVIVDLPVVSSENLLPAGQTAYLQGLERTPDGTRTNVSIANLGHDNATCTARVFHAGGTQIQSTAFLSFQPLSQRLFADAFNLLQVGEVVDARLEVSCNQPFYSFATIVTDDLAVTRLIRPSASGESTLALPRDLPDPLELEMAGNFFRPRVGKSSFIVDLPLEPGIAYKKLTVEFGFHLDRWHGNLFHSVVGLRRSPPVYFQLFLRAKDQATILDRGDDTVLRHPGRWEEGGTYRIKIEYNTETATVTFRAFEGKDLVESFSGPIAHTDLMKNHGSKMELFFGLRKVFDNAYFPPWDWRFFDLQVLAEP